MRSTSESASNNSDYRTRLLGSRRSKSRSAPSRGRFVPSSPRPLHPPPALGLCQPQRGGICCQSLPGSFRSVICWPKRVDSMSRIASGFSQRESNWLRIAALGSDVKSKDAPMPFVSNCRTFGYAHHCLIFVNSETVNSSTKDACGRGVLEYALERESGAHSIKDTSAHEERSPTYRACG